MLRVKILVVCLLLSITVFSVNAYALSAGTPFTFGDIVFPGATNTWTHSLSNTTDFFPQLSGSEPLIINSGYLFLNLTFTPTLFLPGFYLYAVTPSLDSYYTGNTFFYGSTTPGTFTANWFAPITSPSALNAIADKNANIILTSNYGNLNSVNVSALSGTGVVAPEPVSMLLVGAGIAGLPVARRFRRLIKR
jgi:hypothetical protein